MKRGSIIEDKPTQKQQNQIFSINKTFNFRFKTNVRSKAYAFIEEYYEKSLAIRKESCQ